MTHHDPNRNGILEPLVTSALSSGVSARATPHSTAASRAYERKESSRTYRTRANTRGSEKAVPPCRRDPVSGLAVVPLALLEDDHACRCALAAVLASPPSLKGQPTQPSAMGRPSSASRAHHPAGLVHSVLNDTAEDARDSGALSTPTGREGLCPVIFYTSAVDLFMGTSESTTTTTGRPLPRAPSPAGTQEPVVAVPAHVVLSRTYMSLWSSTGELYACCAVPHITTVTRCASAALLIRGLPACAPLSRPPSRGADWAFCLADAQETDFFLVTLMAVAQLPQRLRRDTCWLESRAASPVVVDEDSLQPPWQLSERPYTPLLALTSGTQLLPLSARVSPHPSLLSQLVPWMATSIADALDPQQLFTTFIAEPESGTSGPADSPYKSSEVRARRQRGQDTRASTSVEDGYRAHEASESQEEAAQPPVRQKAAPPPMSSSVRCALAMLQIGVAPRRLLPFTETTGRALVDEDSTHPPQPTRRLTYLHEGKEEQWYFAFPEHHEASSLLDDSVDDRDAIHTAPTAASMNSSVPDTALHEDESFTPFGDRDDGPDAAAVQQLLERLQQQQTTLAALLQRTRPEEASRQDQPPQTRHRPA